MHLRWYFKFWELRYYPCWQVRQKSAQRAPSFPEVSQVSRGTLSDPILDYHALMKIFFHHLCNPLKWPLWAPSFPASILLTQWYCHWAQALQPWRPLPWSPRGPLCGPRSLISTDTDFLLFFLSSPLYSLPLVLFFLFDKNLITVHCVPGDNLRVEDSEQIRDSCCRNITQHNRVWGQR